MRNKHYMSESDWHKYTGSTFLGLDNLVGDQLCRPNESYAFFLSGRIWIQYQNAYDKSFNTDVEVIDIFVLSDEGVEKNKVILSLPYVSSLNQSQVAEIKEGAIHVYGKCEFCSGSGRMDHDWYHFGPWVDEAKQALGVRAKDIMEDVAADHATEAQALADIYGDRDDV